MRLLPLLVFCLASLLSGSTILRAQSFHLTPRSAAVEVDGRQLRYPFAGGLNKPQASAVDFDQDGRQDLFYAEFNFNGVEVADRAKQPGARVGPVQGEAGFGRLIADSFAIV